MSLDAYVARQLNCRTSDSWS